MDTNTSKILNTTIDFGNQENARIFTEIDELFKLVKETGAKWLRVTAAAYAVMEALGYEDLESFEATMGETFESWARKLGCLEFTEDELGFLVFRMKENEIENKIRQAGFTLTLPIRTREHLQVVCVKSPDATIYIPELEFSCGADEKTVIDTIYNHVCHHIFTLEIYAKQCEAERKFYILETVEMLRKCLDLDMLWNWIIVDPSGKSEIDEVEGLISHNFVNIPEFADRDV